MLILTSISVLGQFQFLDFSHLHFVFSYLFENLVIFDGIPDIVNIVLSDGGYFSTPIFVALFWIQ